MLRQVYVVKDDKIIFQSDFGKALDEDGYRQVYKIIIKEADKVAGDQTGAHEFFKYRIAFTSSPEHRLLFIFVSDLSDRSENVTREIIKCKEEFLGMFEAILDEQLDEGTFEIFGPTIDSIHKNLRPKLALVGFSGVGKTTITRLIMADEIPMEHVPTITGDIATIKIGKLHFMLWDFAGQEQFSFLWNNFIKGSDGVLLITDSTLENCEKSKYFVELIRKEAPYSHMACIGNKQDLPDAMPIPDIERLLGIKAYSMVANDPENRDKMITIIADVLEMSGEVSPLLKPLMDRDRKVKSAEAALESGDFAAAAQLFEDVADLCLQLGDDRVSLDFHEKAKKIKSILKQMGGAQSPSTAPAPKLPPTPGGAPVPLPPTPGGIPVPLPPTPGGAPVPLPPTPRSAPVPLPGMPSITKPNLPPMPNIGAPNIPPMPASSQPAPSMNNGNQLDALSSLLKKLQTDSSAPQAPKPSNGPATGVGSVPSILNLSGGPATAAHIGMNAPPPPVQKVIPPPAPTIIPTAPVAPVAPAQPVSAPTPNISVSDGSNASGASNAAEIQKMITETKIKIANINKTLLDLEMQNITGELSDEEYQQKSTRMNAVKSKMEQQIKDLQAM